MDESVRTYAVVVNMDYAHHSPVVCKEVWNEISQKMLDEDFRFEKRMFILSTEQDKQFVCDKARNALENLDGFKENFKQGVYLYVKDFFAIDMTGYNDLILPDSQHKIEVQEEIIDTYTLGSS